MITAHYAHRLPADYDIALIRERAKKRGAIWDAVPDLFFKAFLLRERGRFGAIASSYSSLYLWRHDEAFRDFLVSGRYKVVTDGFGRAEIQTGFALDARKGSGQVARFAYKDERRIALDADLTATFAAEIERSGKEAEKAGAVAAIIAIDAKNWTLTRLVLSEHEPDGEQRGEAYEILHLARPLLETLPRAADQ
ncbi:hypothetical protein UP09_30360 [Bradyrhizobium sp. LTSP885]|uniref:DUF4865 family protein n=1 Tax=Bradyrhizobium sp. LTSP885 TaxID=1619232 RepID=UPI0005C9DA33|nr:DUF4865 family protein [Bradyrhizobium sp. LTSP885]KJC36157.1 hypothetical protein UP09_30360 [Bradyrhizobium sp. LTSP885]